MEPASPRQNSPTTLGLEKSSAEEGAELFVFFLCRTPGVFVLFHAVFLVFLPFFFSCLLVFCCFVFVHIIVFVGFFHSGMVFSAPSLR